VSTLGRDLFGLIPLALAWCAYFLLHSLLASLTLKRWVAAHWPRLARGYRVMFNLQAVVLGGLLVWWTHVLGGDYLWQWAGAGAWVANGLALTALLLFFYSLTFYDGGEFLGLNQLRGPAVPVEDQEQLKISPLHRFVRHPWYALALVMLWTRDMDAPRLLVVSLVTAYFLVGSRLEERKLIRYHGDAYRRYRKLVPAFIPSPLRRLTAAEAVRLEAAGETNTDA
jgi:protein-S-isoprenylcysteine O-methyltransferase Ste14